MKDWRDWKAPIDTRIPLSGIEEADLIRFAVGFYTATDATVSRIGQTGLWHVTAVGYRMGPAGP